MQINTHPAHHERNIFKFVSGAGPLFTSQRYPPLVIILVMSHKLWFERDIIRKALVGILMMMNDEYIIDETHNVEGYDEDENE